MMAKKFIIIGFIFAITAARADDCPTGYSILDDSGLCKVQCNAGYYVATAGATCIALNATNKYTNAHTVAYGEVSTTETCPNGGSIPTGYNNGGHILSNCVKGVYNLRYTYNNGTCVAYRYSTHGTGFAQCYYMCDSNGICGYDRVDSNGNPLRCVGGSTLQTCDAGYYAAVVVNGLALQDHPCRPVGMGYYSPDGDLNRYACPENTATCGRGDCAAAASDCVPYRTLHIGSQIEIKMPARQYTEPSLVARMSDGVQYYAQSSSRNIEHGLKVRFNNQTYSIINAEDDFCPNGADPNP